MKTIRDYMITTGITLVLVLSVCLAEAQAPDMPPLPDEAMVVEPAPVPDAEIGAQEQPPPVQDPVKMFPRGLRHVRPSSLDAASNASALPAGMSPASGMRTITPSSADPDQDASAVSATAGGKVAAVAGKNAVPALKFDNTASDIVLMAYAEQTKKTLLIAPDVPKANITLRSQPDIALTAEEYVEAIEVVLSMNGIVLEPFGEKFVKVLARKSVRTDGIEIIMTPPEEGHPEKTRIISQMIQLIYITLDEAKKAIEGFKKPDGMIQTFERTNSMLVTDTQENINRMLEIINFMDKPIPVTEEPFIHPIKFAKAEDIKKRLEEIVTESLKGIDSKTEVKSKTSGSPGMAKSTSTASSISSRLAALRNRTNTPEPAANANTPNVAIDAVMSDADRGMIRGKVLIMADERTNKLIIITNKENNDFFKKIIDVLDIETAPDVQVEYKRLEYADAEEVSTMLNDLIGNASSKKDDSKNPASKSGSTSSKSTTLAEAVKSHTTSSTSPSVPGKSKLGELSKDNIKILADKRTNAIVMMGSRSDLAAIAEIIKQMDIKLAQVLIETVVLEVGLSDKLETGINWVRRINNSDNFRYNLGGGGIDGADAINLFGVATNAAADFVDSYTGSSPVSGVEYFMTFKNLRLDTVVKAAQSDSRTRVLSSPVLLTVDNKEASIEATDLRYMYKGMRYMGYGTSGGTYEPDVEQRDVGLSVKITPRINPNGNVILTIEESFENIGADQQIGDEKWPTITTRKLSADVSVGNGETVILGGLVQTTKKNSEGGIPILKSIPVVGKYLFGSTSKSTERSEMLVFLTPYVLETDEDARSETRRRKDYLDVDDVWTKGWSASDLADPMSVEEMKTRLEHKKALADRWKEYAGEIEEHKEIEANIEVEREKALQILKSDSVLTNDVPPAAGVMKVEEYKETLIGRKDEDALPEDEAAEPDRPDIKQEKRPWWKLF